MGNNSKIKREDIEFHRVRLERLIIKPLLKQNWRNKLATTRFGPFYETVRVIELANRISTDPGFSNQVNTDTKNFLGFIIDHQHNVLDNQTIPSKGSRYQLRLAYYRNLLEEQAYARIDASYSRFFHAKWPFNFTFGSRTGAATLSDNRYYFYHSNSLGNNNYLHGFRENRYSGSHMVYQNFDVRIPLVYFHNHLAPGTIGVLAGFDTGRIWFPFSNTGNWKTAFTYGIWWAPYKFTAINANYTITGNGEQDIFTLKTGKTIVLFFNAGRR